MKQTWLSLSMRVDSSWKVTIRFFCSWLMLADHAIHFAIGSAMMNRQELVIHPRKVMVYLRPPSASILRIEAGYGRFIGSNAPAKGLKWWIWKLQMLGLTLTPFYHWLGSLVTQWIHHQCIHLIHLCTMDPSWRLPPLLLQMWRHCLVIGAWVVVVRMGKVRQVGPTLCSEWGHLLGRIRFQKLCKIHRGVMQIQTGVLWAGLLLGRLIFGTGLYTYFLRKIRQCIWIIMMLSCGGVCIISRNLSYCTEFSCWGESSVGGGSGVGT